MLVTIPEAALRHVLAHLNSNCLVSIRATCKLFSSDILWAGAFVVFIKLLYLLTLYYCCITIL